MVERSRKIWSEEKETLRNLIGLFKPFKRVSVDTMKAETSFLFSWLYCKLEDTNN